MYDRYIISLPVLLALGRKKTFPSGVDSLAPSHLPCEPPMLLVEVRGV